MWRIRQALPIPRMQGVCQPPEVQLGNHALPTLSMIWISIRMMISKTTRNWWLILSVQLSDQLLSSTPSNMVCQKRSGGYSIYFWSNFTKASATHSACTVCYRHAWCGIFQKISPIQVLAATRCINELMQANHKTRTNRLRTLLSLPVYAACSALVCVSSISKGWPRLLRLCLGQQKPGWCPFSQ